MFRGGGWVEQEGEFRGEERAIKNPAPLSDGEKMSKDMYCKTYECDGTWFPNA